MKNLVETEPTFKPAINKSKKDEASDKDRVASILEKGKAYQERKEQMAKAKDLETDPEATFMPKINPTKPKKGAA